MTVILSLILGVIVFAVVYGIGVYTGIRVAENEFRKRIKKMESHLVDSLSGFQPDAVDELENHADTSRTDVPSK